MAETSPLFWLLAAAVVVVGYLLGGIPWALIIGKRFFGIDPREHGSGNLGTTNVFRLLGWRAGGTTLVLDASKGALAVAIAKLVITPASWGDLSAGWAAVAAGGAAVLGHAYSPYIRFQGGKGVATSAGVLAVLTPVAVLFEVALFVTTIITARMVSVASLLCALAYPPLVFWLYPGSLPLKVTSIVLAVLVIWRHRTNIGRIVRGEETRIDFKRTGNALRSGEGE